MKEKKLFKKSGDGLVFSTENYDVIIKYDEESTEKELIKFKKGETEIVIDSDTILTMIREQFRQKEIALALSTTDINFIPVIEVAIPISYISNKDIKEGERVQFFAPFHIPVGMARAMEAHNLCMTKGKEIKMIPKEDYEETANILEEASKKFVEEFWKPQIDQLKELRKAADNG